MPRTRLALILVLVGLLLVACGGGNSRSTSTTSTATYHRTTQGPKQVPPVAVAVTACRHLSALGSGTSAAARLRGQLDAAIKPLSAFAASHAPPGPGLAKRLRVKSVLPLMEAVSRAAARYVAAPSAAARQALTAAINAERNDAIAENITQCAIPVG